MRLNEARQIIREVFDNPYPFQIKTKWEGGQPNWSATWNGGRGRKGLLTMDDTGLIWDVNFSVNRTQAMTGKGDAFKVMATVLAILDKILSSDLAKERDEGGYERVQGLMFTSEASDSGRRKLYTRLAKKLAGKYGMTVRADHNIYFGTKFLLHKKPKKKKKKKKKVTKKKRKARA